MEQKIRFLVIDVDGTMTDAGIYYDEHGNEMKKFSTKDAAGFFVAKQVGISIIVLTGRECMATTRRIKDLQVDFLFQNIKSKGLFLKKFMAEYGITPYEIGYIGDDLNDLSAMQLVGFKGCPADSCREVLQIADYVSNVKGGHGAVRDIIEMMLRKSGQWSCAVNKVYGIDV